MTDTLTLPQTTQNESFDDWQVISEAPNDEVTFRDFCASYRDMLGSQLDENHQHLLANVNFDVLIDGLIHSRDGLLTTQIKEILTKANNAYYEKILGYISGNELDYYSKAHLVEVIENWQSHSPEKRVRDLTSLLDDIDNNILIETIQDSIDELN